MNRKKAIVIGAGFSGLSTASFLARDGFEVTILEKNSIPGGRARKFEADGFTFDMGPSWYWMPDVFEKYFSSFDKEPGDYYHLKRLDPSYRIVWGENDFSDLPANYEEYCELFESLEKGSSKKLMKFLEGAQYKYNVGINKLVYKKSASPFEFADPKLISGIFKLDVFKSFHDHVRTYFKHPKLIQMLEFPVLFLGGTPKTTPALYSLMNYGDIMLGTWYPEGGMYKVVEGMESLAKSLGVEFIYDTPVSAIEITDRKATGVIANGKTFRGDVIIGSADYNHIEQQLLPEEYHTYTNSYWESRVMSPSSVIYYLGINKIIPNLKHHTLIFDEDFNLHADEIYEHPQWPVRPAVYISNTSKSDLTVAPAGMENIMVLIPVAPGLKDTEEIRERYYQYAIEKMEKYTGEAVGKHVVFKKSYAHNDFINDYNAYKGNAYGLANTLMQTAFLKPKMQSKKIKNLFYAGQLTVPGPGVPPAIISGQVVAREIVKLFKNF